MLYKGLSITTRGIGLGTCNLCNIAALNAYIVEPPVYAMYRVFLGLAEAKVRSFGPYTGGEGIERSNIYNYNVYLCMLELPQTVAIVPTPIKRIIDGIGIIIYERTTYSPVVAAQVRDEAGRLVPRPENLLLSNLREVVVALSTEDTPAEYRTTFKANCPIPGAVWNNNLLLNADEIIPEDYDLVNNLSDDMGPVEMFLTSLQEKYPMMASGPLSRTKFGIENQAALVTSRMGDLRAMPRELGESIERYCQRCYPLGGFQEEFYMLKPISEPDRVAGQVALLGEQPNEKLLGELAGPVMNVHGLREQSFVHELIVFGDYLMARMVTNKALLSLAASSSAQRDEPNDPEMAPPRPDHGNRRGRGPRSRRRNYQ